MLGRDLPTTAQLDNVFFVCRFQHRNCGLSGYLLLPWHSGQPHLCGDVTNSTGQDILVPSGQPSFIHVLTTRSTPYLRDDVTNSAR